MLQTMLLQSLPDCLVIASPFPFTDDCTEAGEDKIARSVALPPIDFCRLNDPAEVPFRGVIFVPQLLWPER